MIYELIYVINKITKFEKLSKFPFRNFKKITRNQRTWDKQFISINTKVLTFLYIR